MSTGDGTPPRSDDPPLELELADVPRRRQRIPTMDAPGTGAAPGTGPGPTPGELLPPPAARATLPPPSIARDRAPLPPVHGRAMLDDPSPWWGRAFIALVVAAVAYVGWWGYKRWFRPNVIAIRSPYKSSTGVVIDLPSRAGWHSDRRHRLEESNGPAWMRGDVMFHGPDLASSDEYVMVLRIHAPGGFARPLDDEPVRRGLEASIRQGLATAGGTANNLSCLTERTWRGEPGVVCYGRGMVLGREIPGGVYFWVAGTDDVVGVLYARDEGPLTPLETMVRSAH